MSTNQIERIDESFIEQESFTDHSKPLNNYSTILMKGQRRGEYYEVPANLDRLKFDEGNLVLEILFEDEKTFSKEKVNSITSIKHHVNTWGISTNNWFNEKLLSKLVNLEAIDFSDTIKFDPRNDLCTSISKMLLTTSNNNMLRVNL